MENITLNVIWFYALKSWGARRKSIEQHRINSAYLMYIIPDVEDYKENEKNVLSNVSIRVKKTRKTRLKYV